MLPEKIMCDVVGGMLNRTVSGEEEDFLNQEIRQGWFIWTHTECYILTRVNICTDAHSKNG